MSTTTGDIYVEVGKDNVVTLIHAFPFDPKMGLQATREELEERGVFVSEIPEPENIIGKIPIRKYNPDTNEIYYEYKQAPLSTKERVDAIEECINDILMSGLEV